MATLRKSSSQKISVPSQLEVQLSDAEEHICRLLDDYVKDAQKDPSTQTVCRIAGGWVRDKLMNSQSNDIDIALSNTMGLPFAEGLAAYANKKGVEIGTISKIAQNPEQSKHLETATFKAFGLDIDLVNLRSEEYATDSRIPTCVTFGTPLQDALRRDITINALFYNVHTREVEDFTGQGIKDLHSGIIRTPLPPRETFLDDPLRVLRCIRFAGCFGFDIIPEIEDAAKDPLIQEAIINKVARERVGEELSKMLQGRDPLRSIELIQDLSLYDPIFLVIPKKNIATLSGKPATPQDGVAAVSILHHVFESQTQTSGSILPNLHPLFYQSLEEDPTCSVRLYLAASLTPYKRITYREKKNKERLLVELVIRESLKLGKQYHFLDGVPLLFSAADIIPHSITGLDKKYPIPERVGIGLLLREKSVHNSATGSHWSSSFLFSLVQELVGWYDVDKHYLNHEQATNVINKYNSFVQRVEDLKLQNVGEMKPLLNGRQIVTALEAKGDGAWLKQALDKVIEWQLEHPEGNEDDCIGWLKEQRQAGLIAIQDLYEPASKKPRTKY